MERKNEKEFYLFADIAYNEEEEPKIYAENGEDVGSVSGADAGRTSHEYFRKTFFGGHTNRRSSVHVSCLPTDRDRQSDDGGRGQQAGIPLLEARVSGGRYHDREQTAI